MLRCFTDNQKPGYGRNLFYLDPPYVGTDQGHYDGYSQDDFNALLELLTTVKGTFLLSSFRNQKLSEYIKRNKWHMLEFKMTCSMTAKFGHSKAKIEVLTANYPLGDSL